MLRMIHRGHQHLTNVTVARYTAKCEGIRPERGNFETEIAARL